LPKRRPSQTRDKEADAGQLVVHHFGPDPTTVGGMASLIRILTEKQAGGDVVDCYPTWTPRGPLHSAQSSVRAVRRLLKTPITDVAHIHLSERGSFLREGAVVAIANSHGSPTVVTIHGASFVPFAQRHPLLVGRVLDRADIVTCLEPTALEIARRSAPRAVCELVPNPVEVDEHSVPADTTSELVVFAGEIGLRKGADIFQRAWGLVAQRRPNARCLLVGPAGDYAPSRGERLEVRGPVDPVEMRRILRDARVVVLPSRAEGMPMILTEAMSVGRPFVSTPVGGIPELAKAGGLLVPVGDDICLADRITELLARPELARKIGEEGRRFCIETRSVSRIGDRLRALYSEAALERGRRDR
jgi:glycosyltransferase involved in cell wall biosynthesis